MTISFEVCLWFAIERHTAIYDQHCQNERFKLIEIKMNDTKINLFNLPGENLCL